MWLPSSKGSNLGKRSGRNGLVAVAIDNDKGSQYAIRWAIENLLSKGKTVILIHVVQRSSTPLPNGTDMQVLEKQTEELFITFHCFCTRKDVLSYDVILEDTDIAKAIIEYVSQAAIESLVLGAARHGFIRKLKMVDIPSIVSKGAPDFCTVYVISKTKISSVRNASRQAPFASPLSPKIQQMQVQANSNTVSPISRPTHLMSIRGPEKTPRKSNFDDVELVKSPVSRGQRFPPNMFTDFSESDTDISFVGPGTPCTDRVSLDRSSLPFDSRPSTSSESSFGSIRFGTKYSDLSSFSDFSTSTASTENDDVGAEMRRLKLELQKTMEMYSTACKEALSAQQKAMELHQWRIDEERRLAEESTRMTAEQEKAKYPHAGQRVDAEKESYEGSDEDMSVSSMSLKYRRYTIEEIEEATEFFAESRKIGEGGYGPVYKCQLDHTRVAVKVLRPDAAQGRAQFQREVKVLSCLRHPNMVLLLGACPEYGCLVYEYMANGSLDNCLFRKGNMRPLSWQLRFRIAAEVATGLNFLHQTKPEPLVHRDLKPGNILLDQNYASKIGDVGLARLVPPSIADDVTQYRLTSTAGTFCYIDPEYQQTGMLGVKSDVYSLGVVLLQILTAKPPMGLTHLVEQAMETGTEEEMLDPSVPDWPVKEAMALMKLALQCAELRRKDRPDLGKVVLPELNKLREFGEENMSHFLVGGDTAASPSHSYAPKRMLEFQSDPQVPSACSEANASPTTESVPENPPEIAE